MSAPVSRVPIMISSLALVVSISGLLTTWRFTSEARVIEYSREKYALLHRVERAVVAHEKMLAAARDCAARRPGDVGLRELLAKFERWDEVQRDVLARIEAIDETSGLQKRVELIKWSSEYDSSFSEEFARENLKLVEQYCAGASSGGQAGDS